MHRLVTVALAAQPLQAGPVEARKSGHSSSRSTRSSS